MKGEFIVNHVLAQKLDRERKITRKNSIIVDAKQTGHIKHPNQPGHIKIPLNSLSKILKD